MTFLVAGRKFLAHFRFGPIHQLWKSIFLGEQQMETSCSNRTVALDRESPADSHQHSPPFPLNPFWYLLQSREIGSRLFHPLLEHQSHVQNTFTSAEIAAVKAHNTYSSQCPTTGLQGRYPIIPSLMSSGESQVSQKWKFTATPPIFKAKPFV